MDYNVIVRKNHLSTLMGKLPINFHQKNSKVYYGEKMKDQNNLRYHEKLCVCICKCIFLKKSRKSVPRLFIVITSGEGVGGKQGKKESTHINPILYSTLPWVFMKHLLWATPWTKAGEIAANMIMSHLCGTLHFGLGSRQ